MVESPPANLHAYKVTILRGGQDCPYRRCAEALLVLALAVAIFAPPRHDQSNRPMSSGLLPHYDNNVNNGTARPTRQELYQIMELAGIYRAMPATGERGDIGPVTEWQGEYICTERKSALEQC